jgi:hypothetical protein
VQLWQGVGSCCRAKNATSDGVGGYLSLRSQFREGCQIIGCGEEIEGVWNAVFRLQDPLKCCRSKPVEGRPMLPPVRCEWPSIGQERLHSYSAWQKRVDLLLCRCSRYQRRFRLSPALTRHEWCHNLGLNMGMRNSCTLNWGKTSSRSYIAATKCAPSFSQHRDDTKDER